MTLCLSAKGYQMLEAMWRTFIWGAREDGSAKRSHVAWEVMQNEKRQGGMQILPLAVHSKAVKVRQISHIMSGATTGWSAIARGFIQRNLEACRQRNERRRWTVEETLLIGPRLQMKESATLNQLLKPWYKVRESLIFNPANGQLTKSLTVKQFMTIARRNASLHRENEIRVNRVLKRVRVDTLEDLHLARAAWYRLLEEITRARRSSELGRDLRALLNWIGQVEITSTPLHLRTAELYRVLWRERNDLVFRNQRARRPLQVILRETRNSVTSWFAQGMPDRHKALTVKTVETLMQLGSCAHKRFDNRARTADVGSSVDSAWPPDTQELDEWNRQREGTVVGEVNRATT
ncbi:hypothetical protein R1sor_017659 [Riccia sorocarpa]|uniref:Reverse transcriptase n=1 Tax=Riccia sorocarpa TaxID=122646 RepID=A0ABD3IA97_9MARC